jgi:hypothetical protein
LDKQNDNKEYRMETRNTIDINGLDKAEVLAALYNNAKMLGIGFFGQQALGSKAGQKMTKEEAQKEIDEILGGGYELGFDYLHGKPLKINIAGNQLNASIYDKYNGEGAAAQAIQQVKNPSPEGEYAIERKLTQVREDLKQDPKEVLAKADRGIRTFSLPDKHEASNDSNNYCGLKKGFYS